LLPQSLPATRPVLSTRSTRPASLADLGKPFVAHQQAVSNSILFAALAAFLSELCGQAFDPASAMRPFILPKGPTISP
jgi:hypothetical protein